MNRPGIVSRPDAGRSDGESQLQDQADGGALLILPRPYPNEHQSPDNHCRHMPCRVALFML